MLSMERAATPEAVGETPSDRRSSAHHRERSVLSICLRRHGCARYYSTTERAAPKEMAKRVHADALGGGDQHERLIHSMKWLGMALFKVVEQQGKENRRQWKTSLFLMVVTAILALLALVTGVIQAGGVLGWFGK